MERYEGSNGRFRDSAWDNQLDNMLDDLQNSVAVGDRRGPPGAPPTASSQSYKYTEMDNGHKEESRQQSSSRTGGENGQPLIYTEQSKFSSSTVTSSGGPLPSNGHLTSNGGPMGSKRAVPYQNGHMEQNLIDEKNQDVAIGRGRSDSLVSDLSSIAKVKSVSRTGYSSSERYETREFSTSNTQQSIKKNINDLDHLLHNLSNSQSQSSSKPQSRDVSPSRQPLLSSSTSHVSRSERLISNASNYRSPSPSMRPSRTHSPSREPSYPSTPTPGHNYPTDPNRNVRTPEPSRSEYSSSRHMSSTTTTHGQHSYPFPDPDSHDHYRRPHDPAPINHNNCQPEPSQPEFNARHMSSTSTIKSSHQSGAEFAPVHTSPDPLTGRYPDGRITPNHGYTRNFHGSPMTPRKASADPGSIPKKPEDLLSTMGQEVDPREIQRITQEENISRSRKEMMSRSSTEDYTRNDHDFTPTKSTAGPPVYYPTGTEDLFTRPEANGSVAEKEGEMSQKGSYFAGAYAKEKGGRYKEESGEKGGAAVIPICLPLCCAAPCVIM